MAAATFARGVPAGSPLLPVALAGAALAMGGVTGRTLAFAALGMLTVWARPAWSPADLQPGVAVDVEGRLLGGWRLGEHAWSSRVRLLRIAQGQDVEPVRVTAWLEVGGAGRPPPARSFVARGHLSRASGFRNGGDVSAGALRLRVKSRRLITFEGEAAALARLRTTGSERARMADGAALARALVVGDSHGLSAELIRSFRRLGLGHLLAISGLHVGVVVGLASWLVRLLAGGATRAGCAFLAPCACALVFLAVVGPRPAISRAVGMALVAGLVASRGARAPSVHALALALAMVAAVEPGQLGEVGFWLTASATCGVLWGVACAGRRWLLAALGVGCAAQLFTLPWTATRFHLISPVAAIHNLWAVPWIAGALVTGAIWLVLAGVMPASARLFEPLLAGAVAPFRALGSLPAGAWASVPVAPSSGVATVAAALGAAAMRRRIFLAPALLAGWMLLAPGRDDHADPEILMLDVGQGDSILIRDGPAALLVDGGGWGTGDFAGRVLLPALARLGLRRLEAVILTHPDVDHCGGLVELAAYLPLGEVWTPPGWPARDCLLELVTAAGVRWRPLWSGMRLEAGRWRLEALHPAPGDRRVGNDRSAVLRASARGFTVLLTGDLESRGERELLARASASLGADLLKVGHHGSRTSTTDAFVRAVAPRLAWISAGRDNRFGHPHGEVLARLEAAGARVMRTDRDGRLRLRVDEHGAVHVTSAGPPGLPID